MSLSKVQRVSSQKEKMLRRQTPFAGKKSLLVVVVTVAVIVVMIIIVVPLLSSPTTQCLCFLRRHCRCLRRPTAAASVLDVVSVTAAAATCQLPWSWPVALQKSILVDILLNRKTILTLLSILFEDTLSHSKPKQRNDCNWRPTLTHVFTYQSPTTTQIDAKNSHIDNQIVYQYCHFLRCDRSWTPSTNQIERDSLNSSHRMRAP